VQKKLGRPFVGQPVPETPRQTQALNQNRARQQSLIPIPIEPSRKPVELIPVDSSEQQQRQQQPQQRRPVAQQIPQDEFQKIKQQQTKLQQPQPQPQRPTVRPLLVESLEEIEEELQEEEEEFLEQPKSSPLPPPPPPQQQRRPVPAGGVFAIPQQQQQQQQPQQQQPVRLTAQTDYPRRFEPFTPSPVTRQRSGDEIRVSDKYTTFNDDGSVTWGYQSEDGSFKEETVGIDCITRGRYGYVDPDGQIREFTYESGLPCDPLTKEPLNQPAPKTSQSQSQLQAQADPRATTGYFDYNQNKFVLPNGKRVTVVVNNSNRARGRRSLH